jgi:hypothetical protein
VRAREAANNAAAAERQLRKAHNASLKYSSYSVCRIRVPKCSSDLWGFDAFSTQQDGFVLDLFHWPSSSSWHSTNHAFYAAQWRISCRQQQQQREDFGMCDYPIFDAYCYVGVGVGGVEGGVVRRALGS